jgi:hypothetical protein
MASSKIKRPSVKSRKSSWRQVYTTEDGNLAHPSAPDSSGVFHAPGSADKFLFSGVPHPHSPAGQRQTAHDLGFLDELEREACVVEAYALAPFYVREYLLAETGRDLAGLSGLVPGLIESLKVLAVTTLAGAAGGAVAGTPFWGIGAIPGAIFGAEAGLDAGLYLLFLAGIPALAQYLKENIGQVIELFKTGVRIAWNAPDYGVMQHEIERASRCFARGIAIWCRIVLEAVVVYLIGKGAASVSRSLSGLVGEMRQAGYGALADTVAAEGESLVNDPKLQPKASGGAAEGGGGGAGAGEAKSAGTGTWRKAPREEFVKGKVGDDGVKISEDPRYQRGKFRKGVRAKVFESAKGPDGKVRDPLTQKEIKFTDDWDMGHKAGYEHWKHQQSAEARGLTREEFLDEYNEPEHYRPELPSSNRSHAAEAPNDTYLGD